MINILPTLLHEYNHSTHRSINIALASFGLEDEEKLKSIHGSYHNNKKQSKLKFIQRRTSDENEQRTLNLFKLLLL